MTLLKCLADVQLANRPFHNAVDANGKVIVTCSPDGAVSLFSSNLSLLGSFDVRAKVDGISISPDGEFLGLSMARSYQRENLPR